MLLQNNYKDDIRLIQEAVSTVKSKGSSSCVNIDTIKEVIANKNINNIKRIINSCKFISTTKDRHGETRLNRDASICDITKSLLKTHIITSLLKAGNMKNTLWETCDINSLVRTAGQFGGKKIRIPTQEEVNKKLGTILFFYLTKVEGRTEKDAKCQLVDILGVKDFLLKDFSLTEEQVKEYVEGIRKEIREESSPLNFTLSKLLKNIEQLQETINTKVNNLSDNDEIIYTYKEINKSIGMIMRCLTI